MPLKRTVLPLLDETSETVRRAGGANTVVLRDGRRSGHNTDVPGVSAALRERHDGPVARAVVLGGGATAASALLGLADLGCREVTLLVRDEARAAETVAAAARHPRAAVGRRTHLSGTGSGPPTCSCRPSPRSRSPPTCSRSWRPRGVVFDVVYDPWPTPLAAEAARSGRTLVSGLDLLVHQAVRQVELMTGRPGPLEVMRDAGLRALSARA